MTTSPITTITDELLAELEQLAGKATPGPWWIDSHGHNMVSVAKDHALVFRADDRMGPATRHPETQNLSHWPNDWDASFIATANPDTILALLQHVRELSKDRERLDILEGFCEGYGFEGVHEGNRWIIDGPFRSVRDAIDSLLDDAARSSTTGEN